jgi:hypothetical protein
VRDGLNGDRRRAGGTGISIMIMPQKNSDDDDSGAWGIWFFGFMMFAGLLLLIASEAL